MLSYPQAVTAADAEEGGWIRSFYRVVRLCVDGMQNPNDSKVSLTPLHGFFLALKSLVVYSTRCQNLQIFDLVLSLPLLENLIFTEDNSPDVDEPPPPTRPSTSPPLTGTLELILHRRMESIVRPLLDLPNGLRFRKLVLPWHQENDLRWTNALVVGCSGTLESLYTTCKPLGVIVVLPH